MASHNSKATIWDVAAEAGVSITTVSRYMNGTQRVGPAASEAIERAIRKLDYLPNANVRSIKLRQTRTVAIIVPDISNFFLARVCRRVEHLLYHAGAAGGWAAHLLGGAEQRPFAPRGGGRPAHGAVREPPA